LLAHWKSSSVAEWDSHLGDATDEFHSLARQLLSGFQRMADQIDAELQALENFPFRLHPCWRDLWRGHVLFVGDEVTGMIDPAAVRSDHVATDLSRLLGSFFEDDRERWDAALRCYPLTESFSAAEHRLLGVLDRSSVLLSGLTWIERWSQARVPADLLPQVVDRMRRIARQVQALC
jgi:Ser/Thr protein kinase RdoA (MazF antagonist)